MTRSYSEDVAQVAAAQAGDTSALEALLSEYHNNIAKPADKWKHRLGGMEEAMQVATLAAIEYVMVATPEQARLLRRDLGNVVGWALESSAHASMPHATVNRLRKAHKAMQAVDGSWALGNETTMQDAAKSNDVSVAALLTFVAMEQVESYDKVFDEAFDDEQPFGDHWATTEHDDVNTAADPEFVGRASIDAVHALAPLEISQSSSASRDVGGVLALVAELPERNREAVVLYLEYPEWSVVQIAEHAGIARMTFKSRLDRGLELLAEKFGTSET